MHVPFIHYNKSKKQKAQFAKQKSDAIAKLDGTFVPREKSKKAEDRRPKQKKQKMDTETNNQLSKPPKEQKASQKVFNS